MTLDNKTVWNEAGRAGLLFGGVSLACLLLNSLASASGSAFLMTAAAIILWAVEFLGCILLMKNQMLRLRDRYDGVGIRDAYRFGKRAALLSGLILAGASAILIMQAPDPELEKTFAEVMQQAKLSASQKEQVSAMLDKFPVYMFFGRWLYCYLYGMVLSAIMSRYIFVKNLFDGK